jgi:hypothetical protein
MLSGFKALAGTLQADLARLKARAASAVACYALAGLAFVAALSLGAAAAIVALVDWLGLVEGLAAAAGILAVLGLAVLAINALLRRRHERMAIRASALRSAAIAEATKAGIARGQNATPALLPVAAIVAYAVTAAFVKPARGDR